MCLFKGSTMPFFRKRNDLQEEIAMEFKVEKKEKNMAVITVTVPNDEFRKAVKETYNKDKGKFQLPGFRKGHAPQYMIEKIYGEGVFYEGAVNACINKTWPEASKESGLEIVSRPEIDVTEVGAGKDLVYTGTVAVRPEVTLGEYKGIEVQKADMEVTEADIDEAIGKEQDKNSRLVTVEDRAAENGDTVKINFNGTIDTTGAVVFEDFRKGEYKVTVALDGMQSDLTEAEVSIWNDTIITAHFSEIFAPVDNFVVSGTGFARWTNMIPAAGDVAERYIVNMNDALQGETTNNYMQLNTEDLVPGETYQAKVAVVYTTGMSPWTTANFTFIGCDAVETQVDSLWYDEIPDGSMDVVLHWNNGSTVPTPPTPPTPPTGDVIVKLTAGDVWGDGTGYQMLLDDTHSLYGTTIPTSGALSANCSGNDAIYAQFSHKIPTNADGNCSTSNMVMNNTVEITIVSGLPLVTVTLVAVMTTTCSKVATPMNLQ